MKKLWSFMIGIITMIALFFGLLVTTDSSKHHGEKNVLTIYNWGDYIDPALIRQFEKEYGYTVNYETFDSNEAMYTKIKQGGTHYDIAIPSDYMIQKMRRNHLLVPLDHQKIKGLHHIQDVLLNQPFDPNNRYSIPYFYGTLGIAYNQKLLPKGVKITSWNDLWNPQLNNQMMLIDGSREVMGLALNSLHLSLNSKNNQQLKQAYDKLCRLVPNVKAIVADEMKIYMKQEEASVAVTFSGEAREMMNENKNIQYIIPKEGSNLWFDNMVIPKTVNNKQGAYDFINFMLEPKHAAQNAEYIGYATPNETAKQYLPKAITRNTAFYPTKEMFRHLEVYEDLGSHYLNIYNDYFLEFKIHVPK